MTAGKPLARNEFPAAVPELSPSLTLPALVADLERRRADAKRIKARAPVADVLGDVLTALRALPAAPKAPVVPVPEDAIRTLLTTHEAAERLAVTVRWLYRHADSLPFTRRLSRGALRFDASGLRRWVASRP